MAQLVEHRSRKAGVIGSSPIAGSIECCARVGSLSGLFFTRGFEPVHAAPIASPRTCPCPRRALANALALSTLSLSVYGRDLDTHPVFGRNLDAQAPQNGELSPENPSNVRILHGNAGHVRIPPDKQTRQTKRTGAATAPVPQTIFLSQQPVRRNAHYA